MRSTGFDSVVGIPFLVRFLSCRSGIDRQSSLVGVWLMTGASDSCYEEAKVNKHQLGDLCHGRSLVEIKDS